MWERDNKITMKQVKTLSDTLINLQQDGKSYDEINDYRFTYWGEELAEVGLL